jgi:hypothetical protein
VGILLLYEKHLHASIISLRREVWSNQINLTPPSVFEVPVTNHESERYLCVTGVDFSSFYNLLDFGIVPSVVLFCFLCKYHDICDVGGSWFIYVICIYLRIPVSNTISKSDEIHVV